MGRVHVWSTKCILGPEEMSRPIEEEVHGAVTWPSWPGIKSGLHRMTTPLLYVLTRYQISAVYSFIQGPHDLSPSCVPSTEY